MVAASMTLSNLRCGMAMGHWGGKGQGVQ